jgi:hypothetical protein
MVLHAERPILEADVERAPITAVLVEEARKLVTQVVILLNDPIHEQHPSLSFRMARAHALTLLDHLETMADSR